MRGYPRTVVVPVHLVTSPPPEAVQGPRPIPGSERALLGVGNHPGTSPFLGLDPEGGPGPRPWLHNSLSLSWLGPRRAQEVTDSVHLRFAVGPLQRPSWA